MARITHRSVLVTGGNRGIGGVLVEEALRRGASRVYVDTRGPLAHTDERVTPLTLDATSVAPAQRAVESVKYLDVLINNAGLGTRASVPD
jgi:NAD(P)-dependent dehydrogenase (short-subunit alcohol dehydrogenase family)